AIVIYAYGFEVTQVNLEELGSPTRQQSLARILRALARPDFLEYEQEEFVVERPIYVPCPAGGAPASAPPAAGTPYLDAPPCAEPESTIVVSGHNFAPNTSGPLNFIPPSGVSLQLARIETDGGGDFVLNVELRDRTAEEAQFLRAVTRRNVGWPHLSTNGAETIAKILETVFMALLATTIGTALAIPLSFFAARNLMRTVTSPLTSVALSVVAVPIGAWLGLLVARSLSLSGYQLSDSIAFNIGGVLLLPLLIWGLLLWVMAPTRAAVATGGAQPSRAPAAVAVVAVVIVGAAILAGYALADLLLLLGQSLQPYLADFAFLGGFLANIGGILRLLIAPICALIGAGVLMSYAGQLGQTVVERVEPGTGKVINLVLGALAGATLAALIGAVLAWFYELRDPALTLYWPALIGALAGAFVAFRTPYNASLPVGLTIYTVARTVFNALRSIEALIMVIVFAVWVGIGPFAGVLALGLHTVAALAKLYSEQVESIAAGPMEAILATGANRLQMIVYAVIPQIVPPYISFTMYRWDINVRMSTIIGFAGGGGIGFLLQQNINLLNYRAASAQILAIAIVVSLMDYLSSAMRQRAI
ncbi:MAG: ABC transporter permease subunit, partial [Caldilineaceae bacterium]|nr:ABC transporter permease subunit [Caldilineaceae bacterium]